MVKRRKTKATREAPTSVKAGVTSLSLQSLASTNVVASKKSQSALANRPDPMPQRQEHGPSSGVQPQVDEMTHTRIGVSALEPEDEAEASALLPQPTPSNMPHPQGHSQPRPTRVGPRNSPSMEKETKRVTVSNAATIKANAELPSAGGAAKHGMTAANQSSNRGHLRSSNFDFEFMFPGTVAPTREASKAQQIPPRSALSRFNGDGSAPSVPKRVHPLPSNKHLLTPVTGHHATTSSTSKQTGRHQYADTQHPHRSPSNINAARATLSNRESTHPSTRMPIRSLPKGKPIEVQPVDKPSQSSDVAAKEDPISYRPPSKLGVSMKSSPLHTVAPRKSTASADHNSHHFSNSVQASPALSIDKPANVSSSNPTRVPTMATSRPPTWLPASTPAFPKPYANHTDTAEMPTFANGSTQPSSRGRPTQTTTNTPSNSGGAVHHAAAPFHVSPAPAHAFSLPSNQSQPHIDTARQKSSSRRPHWGPAFVQKVPKDAKAGASGRLADAVPGGNNKTSPNSRHVKPDAGKVHGNASAKPSEKRGIKGLQKWSSGDSSSDKESAVSIPCHQD